MSTHRKKDRSTARCYFRSDRLTEEGGKWYFSTREGTMEGPYRDKFKALEGLQAYITIVQLHLVDDELTLEAAPRMLPTLH